MVTSKEVMSSVIDIKITELKERVAYFKSDECTLSKNTKNTQLFQKNRELKTLRLIKELYEKNDVELTSQSLDTLVSITTLVSERKNEQVHYDINVGDKISDVLVKYKDVTDFGKKLTKYLTKHNLTVDYANEGTIVRIDTDTDTDEVNTETEVA